MGGLTPCVHHSTPPRACGTVPAPPNSGCAVGWGPWRGPSAGNAPRDRSTSFPASRARASHTSRAPAGPVGQGPENPFRPLLPAGSREWTRRLLRYTVGSRPAPRESRAERSARRGAGCAETPGLPDTRGVCGAETCLLSPGVRYPPADLRSLTRGSRFPSVRGRPLPSLGREAFELRGSLAPGAREGFTEGSLVSWGRQQRRVRESRWNRARMEVNGMCKEAEMDECGAGDWWEVSDSVESLWGAMQRRHGCGVKPFSGFRTIITTFLPREILCRLLNQIRAPFKKFKKGRRGSWPYVLPF